MNPVSQLFALVLYEMKEFKRKKVGFMQKLETMRENMEPDKYVKRTRPKNRNRKYIVQKYLIHGKQQKMNNHDISSYFTR